MIPSTIKHTLVGGVVQTYPASAELFTTFCKEMYHQQQHFLPLSAGIITRYHLYIEYCEQIESPVVRMIEPASAINRAAKCER